MHSSRRDSRLPIPRLVLLTLLIVSLLSILPLKVQSEGGEFMGDVHDSDIRDMVRSGMAHFLSGDVAGSLAKFDRAFVQGGDELKARLWQRGLSLCWFALLIHPYSPLFVQSLCFFFASVAESTLTNAHVTCVARRRTSNYHGDHEWLDA